MLDFTIFLGLMFVAHYVGDFPLQSNEMATKKSKHLDVLLSHAAVYTLTLLFFGVAAVFLGIVSSKYIAFWVLGNGILHFVTDFFTSKATYRLNAQGRTHEFFSMIGADQLVHITTILLSAFYLFVLGGPLFILGG